MSDHEAKQATPHSQLIAEIMDSRVPKNEREWAAKDEIERFERELAEARNPLFDFTRTVQYAGDEDEIGVRACCHVLSYKPHDKNCAAFNSLTRLDAFLGEQK